MASWPQQWPLRFGTYRLPASTETAQPCVEQWHQTAWLGANHFAAAQHGQNKIPSSGKAYQNIIFLFQIENKRKDNIHRQC